MDQMKAKVRMASVWVSTESKLDGDREKFISDGGWSGVRFPSSVSGGR